MLQVVRQPHVIHAEGNQPKLIEEFIGRVATGTTAVSIARMTASEGWVEPGQTPAFDEYTLVLAGTLQVATKDGVTEVQAGQAVIAKAGEWVRYSATGPGGASYVAVCLPAFHPETVHRDEA
jgi:quercetin dioxygenase-like cupin family protein